MFLRIVAAIALVGLLVVGGITAYNAGVSEGIAEAARAAAAAGEEAPVVVPPYAYGYGWGHWGGFGFFGILFWIFGIFLFFALLRAAFGWGRWGGGNGPRGGWGDRRERLAEFHRELHRDTDAPSAPSGSASGASTG
jgi:hypothetical protein